MFISLQPSPLAGPVLVSELSHGWEFLRVETVEPKQAAPFRCQGVVRRAVPLEGLPGLTEQPWTVNASMICLPAKATLFSSWL